MNSIYPVPQFKRDDWLDLNGQWNFKFDDSNIGLVQRWQNGLSNFRKIIVPYTYETEASGINDTRQHPVIWYERYFKITDKNTKNKVLLNFGAVDFHTTVFVNGTRIGEHDGGYDQFQFDITEFIKRGQNRLNIRVTDSVDTDQPRGKQRWRDNNFECWYIQSTGIWKPVWLDFVGKTNICHLKITPHLTRREVAINAAVDLSPKSKDSYYVKVKVLLEGKKITAGQAKVTNNIAKLRLNVEEDSEPSPWNIKTWSPNNPVLYQLDCALINNDKIIDLVHSYFGMREIKIKGNKILLNGSELYQRLVLDQNYWNHSGLTPKNLDEMREDIRKIKELGYNGIRLHQTVGDQRFLYLADKMGLLIWSEMPATYEFNDKAVTLFTTEWLRIVKQNYNHPSIITWVPFNESWGISNIFSNEREQNFTCAIYYLTKSIDPYRPVITNDGWEHTISDIITLHDYESDAQKFYTRYHDLNQLMSNTFEPNGNKYPFANGYHYHNQPIIISEFGGIAFSSKNGWGYGKQMTNTSDFLKRFDSIHSAIQNIPFISGYCYTQLNDVQQEVNGLLTIDRKNKIDPKLIKAINTRRQK